MRTCRALLVQTFTVAALCCAAQSTFAADPKAEINGAHEVLKEMINSGTVKGDADRRRDYSSYRGYGCHSRMEFGVGDTREIDWDQVTSIVTFSDFAHLYGRVTRTNVQNLRDADSDAGFWLPDADSAKKLADAMRVLMKACGAKQ